MLFSKLLSGTTHNISVNSVGGFVQRDTSLGLLEWQKTLCNFQESWWARVRSQISNTDFRFNIFYKNNIWWLAYGNKQFCDVIEINKTRLLYLRQPSYITTHDKKRRLGFCVTLFEKHYGGLLWYTAVYHMLFKYIFL